MTGLAALLPSLRWPVGNRLAIPPEAEPVIVAVLGWFPGAVCDRAGGSLARVQPGQRCPIHRDGQPPGWETLAHVPIVTNPGSWHQFVGEERFHMEAGKAYCFYSRAEHSYGNDGDTDRVHLIFDVVRG